MNTDQLFLIAMGPLATLIVVMFGVFLNGRQIDSLRNELRAEIRASTAEIKLDIAKLDQRVERLENERRVIR